MAVQELAAALRRAERVLAARPAAALHEDVTSVARWLGGTRVVASHQNGHQVATDLPPELGGQGQEVTPGWLVRAGLASCTATSIAMAAAAEHIELAELEVQASSRSDARGMLGIAGADGAGVYPGLMDVQVRVRVAADGVGREHLVRLVERSQGASPMLATLRQVVPVTIEIEVGGT